MDAKPLRSATRHYTPEAIANDPYFCPAKAKASSWAYLEEENVKVYIMVGTKEILRDDGLGIVKSMQQAGVDVTLREVSGLATYQTDSQDQDGNHCGPMAQWKGSNAWDVWQADLNRIINS
jgi:acetyl esterase/lipase